MNFGEEMHDPLIKVTYWSARKGEARARLEEVFAIAKLNVSIDTALKESGELLDRLEAALEYSPTAKEKMMGGEFF